MIIYQNNLIERIKFNLKSLVNVEEQISYDIYIHVDRNNHVLNEKFVYTTILIKCILRITSDTKDWEKFISMCKNECKNKNQIKILEEFKTQCTEYNALLWYIHESFLTTTVYKILHGQNIQEMILISSFLRTMYLQLKQNQYKSKIRVYYGQIMKLSEISYLEQSKDGYVTLKTFLRASANQNKTFKILTEKIPAEYYLRVMFVIDADPDIVTTKPFVDISKFSSCMDDIEILFMIGSMFRLIDVHTNGDIDIVRMDLCNENEHNLSHVFAHMEKLNGNHNEDTDISFQQFSDVLSRMGKYDTAEFMYNRTLEEIPPNDPLRLDVYRSLSEINKLKGNFEVSLKYNKKMLEILTRTHSSDFIRFGSVYASMGEVYSRMNNDRKSLEYYEMARRYFEEANDDNRPNLANMTHNIASVYRRNHEHEKALEFYTRALEMDKKSSVPNRPGMAKTHMDIAFVYCHLNRYDLALKHYSSALSIKLDTLDPEHISIADVYSNIGWVYQAQGDLRQAAINYRKAADIYHLALPSNHQDVVKIDNILRKILNEIQ